MSALEELTRHLEAAFVASFELPDEDRSDKVAHIMFCITRLIGDERTFELTADYIRESGR